jgi:hypothetical protein
MHKAHRFPIGIRPRDKLILALSKPGGFLAAGSRPDRLTNSSFVTVVAATVGASGTFAAWCFGAFNQKEETKGYRKTKKLLEVLEQLYWLVPKLSAGQMRERMSARLDTDGSLLFCSAKGDTTGKLLSVEQIQGWINRRTQKRREDERANGLDEVEREQQRLILEFGELEDLEEV